MESTKKHYIKFTEDMEEADRDVEYYNGRNFYHGPAIRCDESELQDVIRETEVKVQWDTMGKSGLIIYPK